MLVSLSIRNFAIIDSCEMELQDGMTALTGETGAGKSILLDALGLVLGDRADASSVKKDAKRAEISACFQPAEKSPVWAWLAEREFDDDGNCILRRVVSREGKSRGYINNCPVSIQTLKALSEMLIDIHGQHEHQTITRPSVQRQLLDSTLPNNKALNKVRQTCQDVESLRKQLASMTDAARQNTDRLDMLRFQIQEFEQLKIDRQELESIETRHKSLANAGSLIETGNAITELLDGEHGAYAKLTQACKQLTELANLEPVAKNWLDAVNTALINCDDASGGLTDFLSGLDIDGEQLEWLDQRLSALDRLSRKHSVTIPELAGIEDKLREELDTLDFSEADVEKLEKELAAMGEVYRKACQQLQRQRKKAAAALGNSVTESMEQLGMQGGVFQCLVEADETRIAVDGWDTVKFVVSPNPGQAAGEISKIASGGELSRISLAVQLKTTSYESVNAFIFDEVDSGIGGGIAETVGHFLRQLAEHAQVLCVTHLPQVAAQAHQHQRVSKSVKKGQTVTKLEELDGEQRVEEIARMLGGRKITSKTRQHASEMIESAG